MGKVCRNYQKRSIYFETKRKIIKVKVFQIIAYLWSQIFFHEKKSKK